MTRVFFASMLLALGACGQKGPLYLPDQGGEVVTRPAGQQNPSPETAPQPSTQPPASTTKPEDEKKR
jgi:predicted small lipoprotein YifL